MNKNQAKLLLDNTFNNEFDLEQYLNFLKEFLNKSNFSVADKSKYINNEFKEFLLEIKKIGQYKDKENKIIELLVVKLAKHHQLDRARTMQRNFIGKWLTKNSDEPEGALVAFYDGETDWRFSFVKLEYQLIKDDKGHLKVKRELTPAKRYSFLVGPNEPNHTCQSQFIKLLIEEDDPSFNEIENAFSIEKVTKEFFEKYKTLFLKLKKSLENIVSKNKKISEEFVKISGDNSKELERFIVEFSKKLMGQIVFLYFLQKKGWLGVRRDFTGKFMDWGTGPKDFMRKLYNKKYCKYSNFFNDVLEPLFYNTLAVKRVEDFSDKFESKIPFLNGGLFEPLDGYDWLNTNILLDNKIFEEIFDAFDEFNFTVKEDEPLEKEVAVDPEMLGKVFEKLLDVTDRKTKGAFYTPREIVHYMCQQSLINYIETNTEIPRKDIEKFIQEGNNLLDQTIRIQEQKKNYKENPETNSDFSVPKSIEKDYKKIDCLLKTIKVVDPAVGSGAFPIGMMNEIVKARSILSIFFPEKRNTYDIKRECIENCLYGVDIMPSAVDICRLRFWLSLIVDELDRTKIKPLPNLDNKIMCGNSLLEEFEGVKLFDDSLLGIEVNDIRPEENRIKNEIKKLSLEVGRIATGQKEGDIKKLKKEIKKLEKQKNKLKEKPETETETTTLVEYSKQKIKESKVKLKKLKNIQKKFFSEYNPHNKKKLKKEIDNLEWELIETTLKEQGNEKAFEKLDKIKKNKSKPFFLWKLYFSEIFQRENPGFDVVIGNPPYVRQELFKEIKKDLFSKFGNFFNGRADLYTYFYKQGINLLRNKGVLAYISSNKFFVRGYGKNLRKFLTNKVSLLQIINFGELPVFKAAVDSAIILINQHPPNKKSIVKAIQIKESSKIMQLDKPIALNFLSIDLKTIGDKEWILESPKKLKLFHKIRQDKILLKEYYNNNIFAGIKTGLDSAFVISEEVKNKLIKRDKKSKDIIKQWLRGKDVKKWRAKFNNLYVIYIPLNTDSITDYSAIKEHLLQFRKNLQERATNQKWFEIQQPQERFTKLFNLPKIIYPDCAKEMRACYDEKKSYGTMSMYFLPYDPLILGILNSNLFDWYSRMTFATFGDPWKGGRVIFKTMYMKEVPIIKFKNNITKKVIKNVEKILLITKDEDYLNNPNKKAKVHKLEKEISQLVYKLYNLTPEEINIIEEFNEGRKFRL